MFEGGPGGEAGEFLWRARDQHARVDCGLPAEKGRGTIEPHEIDGRSARALQTGLERA